jgi:hypothetical protein
VKLKHVALAALIPGVAAGVTVSAAALAAPASPAVHRPARPVASRAEQWVTVQRGQTLGSIAGAHHMSWQAVAGTPPNNAHLRYPYSVVPGEHLRIPADPTLRAAQFRGWERREAAERAAAREQAAAAARARAHEAAAEQTPAQQTPAQQAASPSQPLTAGMSSFEQCVAWRESTDTPTDPDGLFGILPSTWAELGYSGTAGQASVAQQEVAFSRLYAEYGAQPWAPSDGC